MAQERDENFDWSSPEPMSEEGRGLPITDTITPMPEVKPPKQSDNNNSGTSKKEK